MVDISSQIGGADEAVLEGMNGGDAFVFEASEDGGYEQLEEAGLDGLETVMAMNELPVPGQEAQEAEDEDDEDEDEELDEDLDEDDDEDDEEEEDELEEAQPKSRRDKRIKRLVDQKNELQSQMAQMEASFSQRMENVLAQQQNQYNQQFQYMQEQNRLLSEQLQFLGADRKRKEYEELPEIERFKLDMEERAVKRIEPLYEEKFNSLQSEINELKAEKEATKKSLEKQKRLDNLENSARTVLTRDYPHITDPVQRQLLEDQLIGLSATYGRPPEQVSHLFERFAAAFGIEKSKKKKKTRNSTKQARKVLPKSPQLKGGSKGSQAQENTRPSWDVIQKHGYRDYHEWRNDGARLLT